MTQPNKPESIDNSIERKLDTIAADIAAIELDIAVLSPQLDLLKAALRYRVEKRLDGIDNRLWVFMGGILTAALAALLFPKFTDKAVQ